MSRVHDMGGRFGDGPVVPEAEEVKFHADWHPRALAVTLACGTLGLWNLDLRKPAENMMVSGGHTRLPAYLAGATGVIVRHHGTHVLPDSNAHGFGEAPEPLYAVAFKAETLWAHPEHPGDEVVADLWQSYLSRA